MDYHDFLTSPVEDLIANNVLSSHIAKGKFFMPRLGYFQCRVICTFLKEPKQHAMLVYIF